MTNVLVRELCLRPHKNLGTTLSQFLFSKMMELWVLFLLGGGTLAIGYQGGSFSLETLLYMTSNVGG